MAAVVRQLLPRCPCCSTVVREVEMRVGQRDRYYPCGHTGPLAAVDAQPMMSPVAFDNCRPRDSYHTTPHRSCFWT